MKDKKFIKGEYMVLLYEQKGIYYLSISGKERTINGKKLREIIDMRFFLNQKEAEDHFDLAKKLINVLVK